MTQLDPRHLSEINFSQRSSNAIKQEVMLQAENILEVLYISVFYDGERSLYICAIILSR